MDVFSEGEVRPTKPMRKKKVPKKRRAEEAGINNEVRMPLEFRPSPSSLSSSSSLPSSSLQFQLQSASTSPVVLAAAATTDICPNVYVSSGSEKENVGDV